MSALPPLVLVVDDHEDTRLLYVEYLTYHGFAVTGAADAQAAIESARQRTPNLLITDLKMPGMDGFTLLDTFKRDEYLRSVPAVILTAHVAAAARRRAAQIANAEFVAKPCLPNDLLTIVRRMIATV